jgi:hypothetical protein
LQVDVFFYAVEAEIDIAPGSKPLIKSSNPAIKFPIFKADIGTDVKFLGFDLSKITTLGTGTHDDPGWFFVLQETPGETRFGLDINATNKTTNFTWDDLSLTNLSGEIFIKGSSDLLIAFLKIFYKSYLAQPDMIGITGIFRIHSAMIGSWRIKIFFIPFHNYHTYNASSYT